MTFIIFSTEEKVLLWHPFTMSLSVLALNLTYNLPLLFAAVFSGPDF